MYETKPIIPETESFKAKILHHEERDKSSPENITNFNINLVSNTEEGNVNFTFKESTSKPGRLDLMEAMREEIGSHENEKPWSYLEEVN